MPTRPIRITIDEEISEKLEKLSSETNQYNGF